MIINLPHIDPIDTEHLSPDFEESVKKSFAVFTRLTAKDYTDHDRLAYIDNLTRAYLRDLHRADRQVLKLITDHVEYEVTENDDIPDREEFYCFEFMRECYEAGLEDCRLYQHLGGHNQEERRALDVVARIVRIVMNWEAET